MNQSGSGLPPQKKQFIQKKKDAQNTITPEEPSLTPLLKLYIFLTNLSITAHYQEKKLDHPFEQVVVTLDGDVEAEQLEYVLQLSFVEDLQAGMAGKEVNYRGGATLMFSMGLSIEISAEKCFDFYRLFSLINRILPIGHLGINEGNQPPIAYFSYRLIAPDPFVNLFLIVTIIEMIHAFIVQLVPEIKKLAQTDQTAEVIFEEIEQVLIANARDLYKVTKMHEAELET